MIPAIGAPVSACADGEELCESCKKNGCWECKTFGRDINGVPICPFCEDGIPCPVQKRMKVSTPRVVDSGRAPKAERTKPERPPILEREEAMQPKLKCVGCGKGLRKDSAGFDVNLCSTCFKVGQQDAEAPPRKRGPKPGVRKPAPPVREPEQQEATRTHAFALTEAQIDRLFLGSTFEAKCFAVQQILQQERA